MAKISKIRFVNFTFNDNRHIYDQTFDLYKGEDALLSLQNGGGKTVLVQMMMQPIIPKQRLKDRSFKGYFTNIKAPVYAMIEWVLDDGETKVLTGLGVKRVFSANDEADDNLKVVTFTSEYRQDDKFDINNIEILEREKGITRLIDFDKVIKNINAAEKEGCDVRVYRWDSTEDRRDYVKKLLSYGINQSEWKNLMVKINEAEAGLNSFFNDCKTSEALIKKWFIPTIEEQLNKNGNIIVNIRELVKNHANQLVKNEAMLREKEVFDNFKAKSEGLIKSLEHYKTLTEQVEKNKIELGNASIFVNSSLKDLEAKRDRIVRDIAQLEADIKELEYERLSGEHHKISDRLTGLKEELNTSSEKIVSLKEDLALVESQKDVLICCKLRDEINNINARISAFETELEKENLAQSDVKQIVADIEYSLNEKYRQQVVYLETALTQARQNMELKKEQLTDNLSNREKLKGTISSLNDSLIKIRTQIESFEQTESSLAELYSDFQNYKDRPSDAVESLCVLQQQIQENIGQAQDRQNQISKEIEQLEQQCRELRESNRQLGEQKSTADAKYNVYQGAKSAVLGIIKSYEMDEQCIFDKDKITTTLQSDIERFTKLIGQKNLENSLLTKRRNMYQSGKLFEMSDELKNLFEQHNIYAEFGCEWLRSDNSPTSRAVKLRLVKNNPFIPYSLIISRKDMETIALTEFKNLSSVVPIIERENLEASLKVESNGNVHRVGNINFLISFDSRILNKNYLKDLCDDMSDEINNNNQIIKTAQQSVKNIERSLLRLEDFRYTRQDEDKLLSNLETLRDKIAKCVALIEQSEQQIRILRKSENDNISDLADLLNQKNRFAIKKRDIENYIAKFQQHLGNTKEKGEKEKELECCLNDMRTLEHNIDAAREYINQQGLKISSLTSLIEKNKQNVRKYADAKTGKYIDEDIDSLESRLQVLKSEISGRIQNLTLVLEDYRRQRDEKDEQLSCYRIDPQKYIGKQYNSFELEQLNNKGQAIDRDIEQLSKHNDSIHYKIAEVNSDLKHIQKYILDITGHSSPLERDVVHDIDFDRQKAILRNNIEILEKDRTSTKLQQSTLQRIKFSLEDYAVFESMVDEAESITGDIKTHVQKLITQYKKYEEISGDSKNTLTALYVDLESEFAVCGDMFRNLFNSILGGDKRYLPVHALNAFERVNLQIDRKMEQHSIDIKKIDDMESCILDNTISYLRNVYDEMNHIDRNSVIDVDGKRCKMLIITLPDKETLDTLSLEEYIKNAIKNCASLCKQGKHPDGLLENEINTYDLFDRFVSVKKINVTLIKIEPNRLKKKTWKQVISENSGGEKFVSAFVVFISLLSYMRGEQLRTSDSDSKVLIMDNPFGPITSEHLLKPLFEVSKKYNTQMICLTDLKEHTVFDRFNLIYALNIEREVGRDEEYIEVKTIKKDIESEDEVLTVSMFKIDDKSRFERVN